jgi:DNA modification methylase
MVIYKYKLINLYYRKETEEYMFKIFNEDCLTTMKSIKEGNGKVDIILTSPPYNTGRDTGNIKRGMENYERRYDIYLENKTVDEYSDWTVDIFNHYDSILKENGCILYNMSYGNENPEQMYLTVAEVINRTNFTIADTIIWKKKSTCHKCDLTALVKQLCDDQDMILANYSSYRC